MSKIIIKNEFMHILSKKSGFTIKDTKIFWEAFTDIFKECVEADVELNIKGFGHLYILDVAERIRTDPKTLEKIYQPPSKRVTFKLSRTITDAIRKVQQRHYSSATRRKEVIAEMMEKLNKTV